jgi:hypothetical protein
VGWREQGKDKENEEEKEVGRGREGGMEAGTGKIRGREGGSEREVKGR